MNKNNFILIILFLLTSCNGLKEAGKVFRNEKITTTDEFLVKKRNPLVLPPNYDELPVPGSIKAAKENQEEKIKKILKAPEIQKTKKSSTSVEKSILNKIRK
tara:strand:- start:1831 stop:2136 length:306 start_codon:yes stop_codon:yes gene_type:complete